MQRPALPRVARPAVRALLATAIATATVAALPAAARAQLPQAVDSTRRVELEGFVDTYYAYDAGRPRDGDRAFTTQAARQSEFNVNLAHLALRLTGDRVRGRLSLQAGTSVQSNYAAEPARGLVSGPSLSRHLQEATMGVRLGREVWVDGGVFFSHLGGESWLSRDNWTYTRSFVAEYSPYYESGVRLSWQAHPTLLAQAVLVNGWQNVSETNEAKSAGLRLDWTPRSTVALSYYNYAGDEAATGAASRLRVFNGVGLRVAVTPALDVAGTVDLGSEGDPAGGTKRWNGTALIARLRLADRTALGLRAESFSDPDQVVAATGLAAGLRVRGLSANLDADVAPGLRWRSELRHLRARDPLFPSRDAGGLSRGNLLLVTSLALTL